MREEQPGESVQAYTITLFVLAGLMVLGAVMHHWMIGRATEEVADVFVFVRNIELVMSLALITVAVLRAMDSPVAATATAAISILMAIWIPFGTGIFIWWLVSVRKREAPSG